MCEVRLHCGALRSWQEVGQGVVHPVLDGARVKPSCAPRTPGALGTPIVTGEEPGSCGGLNPDAPSPSHHGWSTGVQGPDWRAPRVQGARVWRGARRKGLTDQAGSTATGQRNGSRTGSRGSLRHRAPPRARRDYFVLGSHPISRSRAFGVQPPAPLLPGPALRGSKPRVPAALWSPTLLESPV